MFFSYNIFFYPNRITESNSSDCYIITQFTHIMELHFRQKIEFDSLCQDIYSHCGFQRNYCLTITINLMI